jgi:hypothetical protein
MADPSDYELRAWRDIQRFEGRRLSRMMGNASEKVAIGAAELGKRCRGCSQKQAMRKGGPIMNTGRRNSIQVSRQTFLKGMAGAAAAAGISALWETGAPARGAGLARSMDPRAAQRQG